MKKFLIVMAGFCTVLLSCSKSEGFLDNKATVLDSTAVFSDSARTMGFLGRIYADIGYSFNKGRWSTHGNTEVATDDAEYSFSGTTQGAVILYNGTVSPTNMPGGTLFDFWNVPYVNIRRVNLLMSKLPTTPLSGAKQERVRGEAKFLRAWYYTQLLIAFGGVPNVGDNVYGIDDIINLPRQNFSDLVSYLIKELDDASGLLPASYVSLDAADFGRVTKGACGALKSRILLYAASPLFNGGANTTDAAIAKVVSYPTYDVKYWQAAADAAQAVIASGIYSLNLDNATRPGYGFYQTFIKNPRISNTELIFGLYRPANKDFESYYNPPSRSGAKYSMPTQNMVEAFPMKNGKAITDATSGYNPAFPYSNRDPRFRYTIIFNTSSYANNTGVQAQVFTDSAAASDGYPATTTGYYCRKLCDSTLANGGPGSIDRAWPLIRYAEILLNYAEAINETGQTALAYPKLVELRNRAGIDAGTDGLYGMKAGMSVVEMRAFIQNERRIELAYEDHRWNDIRRWKIAMVTNNGYNKAAKIIRGGTSPNFTWTYKIINTDRLHVFRPEMYLLPIPDDEVRKMPAMVQNPGW